MAKEFVPIDPNPDLRGLIQKIIVTDNKTPITFNVYNHQKEGTTEPYQLLFGFVHSKASTKSPRVVNNDYEYLDNSILETPVLNYTILSTNSVQVVLDKIDTASQDEPTENTEENNG